MTNPSPASILVLGLGNLLRSDDGAGIQAVLRLQQDPRTPAAVKLVDGGTLGLELLQYAWDCSHLLVLDAVDFDAVPGAIASLGAGDFNRLKGGGTVHDLGFADLLAAMRLVGSEPPVVRLIGVQPLSTGLGTELSPPVANALPHLVTTVLAHVGEWLRESDNRTGSQSTGEAHEADQLRSDAVMAKPA